LVVKLVDGLVEKIGEQENKTVEKILQAIREHSKISIREMQIVTDLTRGGVEWNLRNECIIKRVGPAKGGHWKAIEE